MVRCANGATQVELASWVFFCGRYVSFGGFVSTWFGFAIFMTVVVLMHRT